MSEKQFNILSGDKVRCHVKSVPWGFVEPHRVQANANHMQSLERLSERGGLDPYELRCVVNGYDCFKAPRDWTEMNCIHWLEELFPRV